MECGGPAAAFAVAALAEELLVAGAGLPLGRFVAGVSLQKRELGSRTPNGGAPAVGRTDFLELTAATLAVSGGTEAT